LTYVFCSLNGAFYGDGFETVQTLLAGLLVGSMAITAAGSFRRERESGMLELLLVSPMGEWAIITGRLRALWSQFLPVTLLFLAVAFFQAMLFDRDESHAILLYFGLAYLTLPVIGLYFSLARQQFMAAFLWTLLFGAVVPSFALAGSGVLPDTFGADDEGKAFFLAVMLQVGLSAAFALILRHHLARRRFVLQ